MAANEAPYPTGTVSCELLADGQKKKQKLNAEITEYGLYTADSLRSLRSLRSNSLPSVSLEKLDFLKTRALRNSIHLRERGHCFYCLRRTDAHTQCLDHVPPRVKDGCNSYRNLVSSCLECISQEGEQSATDFFRALYRDRRPTAAEFHAGPRRLDAIAAGKLPPPIQHPDIPVGIAAHHTEPVIPRGANRLSPPAFVPRTRRSANSRNLSSSPSALCPKHLIGRKGRPRGPRSGL